MNTTFYLLSIMMGLCMFVARAKEVKRNWEKFVIDPSRVERKDWHQEYQISNSIDIRHHCFSRLTKNQPQSKAKECSSMPNISKHHTKQKREYWYSEQSWINFLITRNSISINNFLKWSSKRIYLKIRWRFALRYNFLQINYRWNYLKKQSFLFVGNPNLCNHEIVLLTI